MAASKVILTLSTILIVGINSIAINNAQKDLWSSAIHASSRVQDAQTQDASLRIALTSAAQGINSNNVSIFGQAVSYQVIPTSTNTADVKVQIGSKRVWAKATNISDGKVHRIHAGQWHISRVFASL